MYPKPFTVKLIIEGAPGQVERISQRIAEFFHVATQSPNVPIPLRKDTVRRTLRIVVPDSPEKAG